MAVGVWIRDYENVRSGGGGREREREKGVGEEGGKSPPDPSLSAQENKSVAADVKQQYIFPPPMVLLLWQLFQDLDDLVLQTEREELQLDPLRAKKAPDM